MSCSDLLWCSFRTGNCHFWQQKLLESLERVWASRSILIFSKLVRAFTTDFVLNCKARFCCWNFLFKWYRIKTSVVFFVFWLIVYIYVFFRTLFVQVCILWSCFALCFWTYRPHLLSVKKAVVIEGVQSHQKFKNRKEKNYKIQNVHRFKVTEESGNAEPSRSLGKRRNFMLGRSRFFGSSWRVLDLLGVNIAAVNYETTWVITVC